MHRAHSSGWADSSDYLGDQSSLVATGGPEWAQAHPLSSVAHPMRIFQMDVIY